MQTKDEKCHPLLRPQNTPAITKNKDIMDKYRPELTKYYYDSLKYGTYLEQLGIKYPTLHATTSAAN